ncbi:MAG: hypothetical protein ACYCW6_00195 [Candidatus Xenobia bacterium]
MDSEWPQLHLRLPHVPVLHVALHPDFITVVLYYMLPLDRRVVLRADHGQLCWVRRSPMPDEVAA